MAPTGNSFTRLYDKRFSEEEQMAFGRFAHLNVRNGHFADISGGQAGTCSQTTGHSQLLSRPSLSQPSKSRRSSMSEPNLRSTMHATSQASSLPRTPAEQRSFETTPIGPSPRTCTALVPAKSAMDQSQLRSVLEKLLPSSQCTGAEGEGSHLETPPKTLPASSEVKATSSAASRLRHGLDGLPAVGGKEGTTAMALDGCAAGELPQRRTMRRECFSTPGSDAGSDAGVGMPFQRKVRMQVPGLDPGARSAAKQRAKFSVQGRKQVLEHFRTVLLQRFRSLYDAFERLHDLATRGNALSLEEFCQAFVQLGVKEAEALETFLVMDRKGRELVSLAELRIALVRTSKQALLWELRCRLLTQGITPNDFSKVKKILEIARRPRHRTVRQRRRLAIGQSTPGLFRAASMQNYGESQCLDASVEESEASSVMGDASYAWAENLETTPGFLPSSSRLSRMDWFQLCSAIGLTLVEAELLFPLLVDAATGMVDLLLMFTVLRADVAPYVSLERFATRVLTRYGSLQSAFYENAAAPPPENTKAARLVHWPEFQTLAVRLDVKDDNVEGLWSALTNAQRTMQRENAPGKASAANSAAEAKDEVDGVTEGIFVRELTTWAPGTALRALGNQVEEHFSDLGELRHALVETGTVLSAPVTPAELDAALLAVGIPGCNVEGVCEALQSAWRGGLRGGSATLDDVVEALHSNSAVHGSAAQCAVRDDMQRFWKKFHNFQAEMCPPAGLADDLSLRHLELTQHAAVEATQGPSPCSGPGMLKASTSLPSLKSPNIFCNKNASAVGQRSRGMRQSRSRQGLPCCAK